MKVEYRPADEKSVREFLAWHYEPPYDIYNCPPEQVDRAVRYNLDPANNVYAMYDQDDTLVGYCSYGRDAQVPGGDYSQAALDIGLMIKPEMTGQGRGTEFAGKVIRNGIDKYAPKKLRVTVAAFNRRAIRVWEKNGFRQIQTFKRKRDGMEFIVMLKDGGFDTFFIAAFWVYDMDSFKQKLWTVGTIWGLDLVLVILFMGILKWI